MPRIDLKASLITEQGHICAYCEQRVIDSDSHIEHLVPQSKCKDASGQYPSSKVFDYNNLVCSCVGINKKGEPKRCGHKKREWYDFDLFISPLDPNCEKRFTYYANGEIAPANSKDKAAKETIERLGLNIPYMKAKRSEAIAACIKEPPAPSDFALDKNGQYMPFYTTIRELFS
jgi:uncharacterized protein (TIGR02646 family)